jgi:hypothetical protein
MKLQYTNYDGCIFSDEDTVSLIRFLIKEYKKQGWSYNKVRKYILSDDGLEGNELEIEKLIKIYFYEKNI